MRFILLILFSIVGYLLPGQSYFNYRFEFHNTPGIWDGGVTALELPDGYIISDGTGSSAYYPWYQVAFMKLDFEGNKVFAKIYGDTLSDRYLGTPGCVFRINDSVILAVGSQNYYTPDTTYQFGLVLWLTDDFDTLFSRSYGDYILPHDTNYIFYNGAKTKDENGFVFTGIKYKYDFPTKALLVKTTLAGDRLWEKSYVQGTFYYGRSLTCTNDGGYAIGGYVWTPHSPPNYNGDPIVIKTDSIGNQKWVQYLGSEYPDGVAMVASSPDSTIIAGFCYTDSLTGGPPGQGETYLRRIRIVKLDYGGNVIWDRKYGKPEEFKELHNIRTNQDGTLIASGNTIRFSPGHYKYVGWILKTENDGDSLWYREYDVLKGPQSFNYLVDVIETSDSGYLACGMVFPLSPDTGSQDGWVLKVDSIGCEAPEQCWVAEDEIRIKTFTPEKPFVVYPNPATDKLTVEFHLNPDGAGITLFNIAGQSMITTRIAPNRDLIELDVGTLAGGLYILAVIIPGRNPVMEKVVVE